MSRKKDLFRLDESDDSGMNEAFPADTEKICPEEASKPAARTAGDPVPVKAAADHPRTHATFLHAQTFLQGVRFLAGNLIEVFQTFVRSV